MSEPTPDTELAALQAALARLTPAPDGINIARLLFRAGQASVPRRSWGWPCATAAAALLAAGLGAVLLLRPVPPPAERLVTVSVQRPSQARSASEGTATPAAPPAASAPAATAPEDGGRGSGEAEYLRLRREVLANGVDALPPPAPWPTARPADDPDTLLEMPHTTREPWFLRLKHALQSGDAS